MYGAPRRQNYGLAFRVVVEHPDRKEKTIYYQVWDEAWVYINIVDAPKSVKYKALISFVKDHNAWRVDVPPGRYDEWKWKTFPIHQRKRD